MLAAYLANGRTIGAGDTRPAAYLPWSLLQEKNFDLDEFPALYASDRSPYPLLDGIPYYLVSRNGHYLSAYGPGAGVLALPVYALPIVWGAKPDDATAMRLEKLAAAIITALSVVFLYWALRGVTARAWALVIVLVYALGTSSLSMSSQALWQHGPSQMFLALALFCLVRGRSEPRYLGYAGFPLAAAVAMRSTDLLLVLPVAAWIVYAYPARARSLVAWALPPTVLMAVYYLVYFGPADQGYGGTTPPVWALFSQMSLREGLPGVLVSPSRGLFVYSPVLLFSLAGIVVVWLRGPALWRALSLGPPLVVLVIAKWLTWWGGHSWGPRLLGDVTPILCFFLYPVVPLLERRRLAKIVFVILALGSIAAHALGAWLYDGRWDGLVTDRRYAQLWPWADSPLAYYGREAFVRLGLVAPAPAWTASAGAGLAGSLAATYTVGPAPERLMTGERFVMPISATNVGDAVWPATAAEDRGAVRLGWRWLRDDRDVLGGRELLLSDVGPGRTVHFAARLVAPTAPDDYTLVLGLVSERIAWFGEGGQPPLRFRVSVTPPDIERVLAQTLAARGGALTATVATARPSYRGDELLELRVVLASRHRPRNLDAYLMLKRPDGEVLFFDGRTAPRPAEAPWPQWGRNLPLPGRADGRFRIPLFGLPAGAYRWFVVLTEPGAFQPVARGSTEVTIER